MSLTTHSRSDTLFHTLRRSVDTKPRSSALVWASAQTLRTRDVSSPELSLGWFLDKSQTLRAGRGPRSRPRPLQPSPAAYRSLRASRVRPRPQSTSPQARSRSFVNAAALRVHLFEAIRRNDQDLVLQIVRDAGMRRNGGESACVNTADGMGTVPLMVVAASNHGSASTGALLLQKGALHNKSSLITGESSIHLAAQRGHCDFLSMLLKRRDKSGQFADVDLATVTGLTALMLAARNGHARAVDILLNKSADKTKVDVNGLKAVDHAKQAGFSDVVRQFVFGTRVMREPSKQEYVRMPLWHLPRHPKYGLGHQDEIGGRRQGRGGGGVKDEEGVLKKNPPALLVFNSCARGWRPHALSHTHR